jgi:beta-mannosidase
MGTLYWQLNDTWPVASWSGLDHGGGWKLMHHMARDFYAPVAAFAIPSKDGRTIAIMGVNDTSASAPAEITVFALSTYRRKDLGAYKFDLPADRAVEIASLAANDIPDDAILHIETRDAHGIMVRRHFAPRPYKSYDFADPFLSHSILSTDGSLVITITAERPAYFVALECDVPGHFSDAAFDLLPGADRTVIFRPDRTTDIEIAAATLRVRDLFSATCR